MRRHPVRLAVPLVVSVWLHTALVGGGLLAYVASAGTPGEPAGGTLAVEPIRVSVSWDRGGAPVEVPRSEPASPLHPEERYDSVFHAGGREEGQDVEPVRKADVGIPGPGGASGKGVAGTTSPTPAGTGNGGGFAVPIKARRVVYLLDRSVSMGPRGALGRARAKLLESLRTLPEGVAVRVVAYNTRAERFDVSAATVEALSAWLDERPASGGTDALAALREAAAFRPDVVVAFTDGFGVDESKLAKLSLAGLVSVVAP